MSNAASWLESQRLQSNLKLTHLERAVESGKIHSVKLDARMTDTFKAQDLFQSLSEVIKDLRAQMQVISCPGKSQHWSPGMPRSAVVSAWHLQAAKLVEQHA